MHFFPWPFILKSIYNTHQALMIIERGGSLKLIKSDPRPLALHPIRQDAVAVSGEHLLIFQGKAE